MIDFDGITYDPARDSDRLRKQLGRVYEAVKDGRWWTLKALARHSFSIGAHDSEAGISARLRDLRKDKFGGYEISREHWGNGEWRYRLVGKVDDGQKDMWALDGEKSEG